MDDVTLASLRAALAATPDNAELLSVVLRALLERDEIAEARSLLEQSPAELTEPAHRALAAQVWLAAGLPERVEALTSAGTPELLLLRARARLEAGDRAGAAEAYRDAVAANPTLQDSELEREIRAHAYEPSRAEQPRLRVLSNDDTDDDDVARMLAPSDDVVRFDDVGGLSDVKKQIHKKIILPFQKPSLFARFRKRIGGGILLFGPPGCGKTLLARATAGECAARFFSVSISDILDMYIGESERKLHAIFEKARAEAPAVLFFDELEGLAGKRQFSREATSSKLVSQFLSEMDGFSQNNSGVLVLGATNVPWAIDAAFRRPGRFDRMQFIPPPDRDARAAILSLQLAERPTGSIDVDTLAKKTQAFSGADLAHLVESAADEAIEASLEAGREVAIEMGHFKAALTSVRPTTLEWLTTARNYARYANEGGHYDEVLDFLKRHGK